ncbi:MAG: hypothetical protein ACPGJS_06380 [Flammeovirgaceae bacterium]
MNRFRITLLSCFIALTLMANECKKESKSNVSSDKAMRTATAQSILDQLYEKDWYHSREEDEGEVRVYRDGSYEFPPSRAARHGFQLKKDGTFWEYGFGPDDRPTKTEGTWEMKEGSEEINMKLTKNEMEESYTLQFISFENNILKLKKMN